MSVLSLNQFAPITIGRCVALSLVLLAVLVLFIKLRPFTKELQCVNALPIRWGHGTTPPVLFCSWMFYQRVGSLVCAILAQLVNIARIAEESGKPLGDGHLAWAMQPFLFWQCKPLHGAVPAPSGPSLAVLLVSETLSRFGVRDGRRSMCITIHLRRGRTPLVRRRRCRGVVLAHANLQRPARRLPRRMSLGRHACPCHAGVAHLCAAVFIDLLRSTMCRFHVKRPSDGHPQLCTPHRMRIDASTPAYLVLCCQAPRQEDVHSYAKKGH